MTSSASTASNGVESIVTLLRGALQEHQTPECKDLAEDLSGTSARNLASLQQAVEGIFLMKASEQEPQNAAWETKSMIPSLIRSSRNAGPAQQPQGQQEAMELYDLWQGIVTPGFLQAPLAPKLQEIEEVLKSKTEVFDVARVLVAVKKLKQRGRAALELVLRALGKTGTQSSESEELLWYEGEMPLAVFHMEDLESVCSRMEVEMPLPSKEPAARTAASRPLRKRRRSGRLSRPGKGASESASRRAGASKRWHVPLQDEARPGRGGGMHFLRRGQQLTQGLSAVVMRFRAVRPRRPGSLAPLPSNVEAEGTLVLGGGPSVLRRRLADMELRSCLQGLLAKLRLLEPALGLLGHVDAPPSFSGLSEMHSAGAGPAVTGAGLERISTMQARVAVMEAALSKEQLPEWMVLMDVPVLPPDLRLRDAGGSGHEVYPDDMNSFYGKILAACRELENALRARKAAGSLRYLKTVLQDVIDATIDNGRVKQAVQNNGKPLQSVAQRIKGKQGRMRSNLLGKRVNFSARTVIVVDPQLQLDQCGMPFKVAKGLYKMFLLAELAKEYITEENSTKMLPKEMMDKFEEESPERQRELLTRAIADRRVMLNRAPTLHRLSVQAFKPILTEGSALKIHPLVCAPFNADFDGDTMTMHLALGEEAQAELKDLMAPSQNLNSPASGDPVIGPTQDMVLGIYYLTAAPLQDTASLPAGAITIESEEQLQELAAACAEGVVPHSAAVVVPHSILSSALPGSPEALGEGESLTTTMGRLLLCLQVYGELDPAKGECLETLDAASFQMLA